MTFFDRTAHFNRAMGASSLYELYLQGEQGEITVIGHAGGWEVTVYHRPEPVGPSRMVFERMLPDRELAKDLAWQISGALGAEDLLELVSPGV